MGTCRETLSESRNRDALIDITPGKRDAKEGSLGGWCKGEHANEFMFAQPPTFDLREKLSMSNNKDIVREKCSPPLSSGSARYQLVENGKELLLYQPGEEVTPPPISRSIVTPEC